MYNTGATIGSRTETVPDLCPNVPSLEAGGVLLVSVNIARFLRRIGETDD